MHVGVARRKSGCFDIYYNGSWIDDAHYISDTGAPGYYKIEEFIVTYKDIIFQMKK